jgi:hypothetical protein
MSVIFPTEPALVNIHLLPQNAEMITYRVEDFLTISAWMPDGFHHIQQENTLSNDEFYNSHCDECNRNCCDWLEEFLDEDGDVDYDRPELVGHCFVYDNGYSGQSCPKGYELDDEDIYFDVANMVFSLSIAHLGEVPRFNRVCDSARLQAGRLNDDGKIEMTHSYMASNVFGTEDNPEGICWGYNQKPDNLREVVVSYVSTPFNNDLTSLESFSYNSSRIRDEIRGGYYRNAYYNECYFASRASAMMILDAEVNIQAYFQMIMAGFKPIPQAPHVMIIPLYDCEFERDGKQYRGFKTTEDAVNKTWYVHPDECSKGLLVGQLL